MVLKTIFKDFYFFIIILKLIFLIYLFFTIIFNKLKEYRYDFKLKQYPLFFIYILTASSNII